MSDQPNKPFKPATCHPDRPVRAKGLCRNCYSARDYQRHKESRDAKHRKWAQENSDRVNANQQRKKAENPEAFKAWRRGYQTKNREKLNAQKTEWRNANRERLNAQNRERYAKKRDAILAQHRAWREANKDRINAANRERRATDPEFRERERLYQLKYNYDFSKEDYDGLYAFQKEGCAICGKECRDRSVLSVDHCHDSGDVRGLLCNGCNQAIGLLQNNSNLGGAIGEYLTNPPFKRYNELKEDKQ